MLEGTEHTLHRFQTEPRPTNKCTCRVRVVCNSEHEEGRRNGFNARISKILETQEHSSDMIDSNIYSVAVELGFDGIIDVYSC